MIETIQPSNRLDRLALVVDMLECSVSNPPSEVGDALDVLVNKHNASRQNDWVLTPRKICILRTLLELRLPEAATGRMSIALGRILTLLSLPRESWVHFIVNVSSSEVQATETGRHLIEETLERVKWKNN